ncbi:MAG: hypothetical protein J7623_01640 [Chitinophaga sp.]|uniref:hypothetical protein n=1 Tax=Chitinophaga sp. TaxID=1869181 RepID=UPI001B1D6743|nr:hypothetical protein [Chitinophaga sp.]MBO9727318.1 hypothetical protein [Chitinophaga sp.]
MKQAKLALTAVAILAVVGGALAFKANTIRAFYSTGVAGKCDALLTNTKFDVTTVTTPLGAYTTNLSTAPDAAHVCPKITIVPGN